MHLKTLTPKQSINKAYLKEKVNRADIERFKTQFISLLDKINDKGDEEHLKSLVADFLKFTWYQDSYQINPIGKNDLVIHTGKSPSDPIGVIIEVKSPTNKPEMLSEDKPNAKAMHELVLYYLRERITNNKHDIKQLIATNIYEWFVFDANEFDKKIYRNTAIKKLYEQKMADGKDNPWFYDELKKLLEANPLSLDVTYFDIRTFKKWAINNDADDDKRLIALYKILSPVHLLKLPFANDSNTLQPKFYSELLHIIGLYEYKDGSKKLISRKKAGERNAGSLLENAIVNIEANDKMSRLDRPGQYGDTYEDRLYTVALELVITWVNRILFLKLLEAQLLKYHKGDKSYTFLNKDKIKDFDGLNKLFFRVLAVKTENRAADIVKLFGQVPYLNSSLFELTELEHQAISISALENDLDLPALSSTVLKDDKGKTFKGTMRTIDYLFEFLNAYDFSSEGAEDIQEDNKTLINASVLGLIFEKINGYKDGSFFTPGFITMYMCRETIRRAVVQKFNEAKGWDLKDYSELYDLIKDKKEANNLINSLKICDPAVGSGHFLVSALNELIAIKSDLNILMGTDGRTLRDYTIEVVNDELIVSDENGDPFAYNYHDHRSQIVQQTLFHEKQTIIENCLFGVDINPNSVKICRLRLWIELLKNAYYKPATGGGEELETLPNIDINIKCGNSLISRFALDADLKTALRNTNWNINDYRIAVGAYKNATDKDSKRELVTLIDSIKSNFRSSILNNGKEYKELSKLRGQRELLLTTNQDLFGAKKSKKDVELGSRRLQLAIDKQETLIDEIRNNKIYQNAFEWRFEFPEVLSDDGEFLGFDAVIGNPPYLSSKDFDKKFIEYLNSNYVTSQYQLDLYVAFLERGIKVLKNNGLFSYITPNSWLKNMTFSNCRLYLLKSVGFETIFPNLENIFAEASVDTMIFIAKKGIANSTINAYEFVNYAPFLKHTTKQDRFLSNDRYVFDVSSSIEIQTILEKIKAQSCKLEDIAEITRGVNPYDKQRGQTDEVIKSKAYHASFQKDETFLPEIRGKHVNGYSYKWDGKHYISYGNWLAAPREIKFFQGPRLIMRQVLGRKLNCTVIVEDFIIDQSVFIAKPKSDYLQYINAIQGILASALLSMYFKYSSNEFDMLFPKIKIGEFRELPVFKDLELASKELSEKVEAILSKQNGEDTTTLETQIDQLVYQLYNLTPEEIKIVEGGA
jgi:adenine-specific DNA-methyltransferase